MKQSNHVVVSESYKRGKRVNAQQRRINQEIDKASESWRSDSSDLITTRTMKLDFNGTIIEVERHLAYNLLHSQEARLCRDQDVPVDYVGVAE